MGILDENSFLSEKEKETYHTLLKTHGHEPYHFILEVKEDQSALDMNDMQYIIIIKTTATYVKSQKSKTYSSPSGSETWLVEFEEDLKNNYFTNKE